MSDIGTLIDYSLPVISSVSPNSIGTEINILTVNKPGANVWPTANLAFFYPVRIGYPYTISQFFWVNGTTVGTNSIDIGIYDSQGNLIVHTGNTLTAGTSATQGVSVTATTLEPGLYYLAMSENGTTDTQFRDIGAVSWNNALGLYQMASANPLPTTAVFAAVTNSQILLCGMSSSSIL